MIVFGKGHVSRVMQKRFGHTQRTHGLEDENVRFVGHDEVDITDTSAVMEFLRGQPSRWVINLAGRTNMEWCEANKAECLAINGHAPVQLGLLCQEMGKRFIHISSGCIFDGNHIPSTEESEPTPAIHYSRCKLIADRGLMSLCLDNTTILRPRMLMSGEHIASNYIHKVMTAASYSAHEEPNSVTYVPDLIDFIGHVMRNDLRGIYNVACHRPTTPYAIASRAQDAMETLDRPFDLKLVTYQEVLRKLANKRVNTVLSTWKAERTGFQFTDVADAVHASIAEWQRNV